jgi:hypothetical protein
MVKLAFMVSWVQIQDFLPDIETQCNQVLIYTWLDYYHAIVHVRCTQQLTETSRDYGRIHGRRAPAMIDQRRPPLRPLRPDLASSPCSISTPPRFVVGHGPCLARPSPLHRRPRVRRPCGCWHHISKPAALASSATVAPATPAAFHDGGCACLSHGRSGHWSAFASCSSTR